MLLHGAVRHLFEPLSLSPCALGVVQPCAALGARARWEPGFAGVVELGAAMLGGGGRSHRIHSRDESGSGERRGAQANNSPCRHEEQSQTQNKTSAKRNLQNRTEDWKTSSRAQARVNAKVQSGSQ